jgi:hypothetical protein
LLVSTRAALIAYFSAPDWTNSSTDLMVAGQLLVLFAMPLALAVSNALHAFHRRGLVAFKTGHWLFPSSRHGSLPAAGQTVAAYDRSRGELGWLDGRAGDGGTCPIARYAVWMIKGL